MELTKAIKILERNVNRNIPEGEIEHNDASKLGIEAMKAWREHRRIMSYPKNWILPGETPPDNLLQPATKFIGNRP